MRRESPCLRQREVLATHAVQLEEANGIQIALIAPQTGFELAPVGLVQGFKLQRRHVGSAAAGAGARRWPCSQRAIPIKRELTGNSAAAPGALGGAAAAASAAISSALSGVSRCARHANAVIAACCRTDSDTGGCSGSPAPKAPVCCNWLR